MVYCYIISKLAKFFLFLFEYLKDLIFHNKCSGPGVILGDFAAGLALAMLKKRTQILDWDVAFNVAWEVSQQMDSVKSDCVL